MVYIFPVERLNVHDKLMKEEEKYCVRQRGFSLTQSARTPPAVHPGITLWVDEIEEKQIWLGDFLEGGRQFKKKKI